MRAKRVKKSMVTCNMHIREFTLHMKEIAFKIKVKEMRIENAQKEYDTRSLRLFNAL